MNIHRRQYNYSQHVREQKASCFFGNKPKPVDIDKFGGILTYNYVNMRGLGQFRNSHLPKALKSHGHLPPLRLGIWQSAVR